MKRCEMEAQKKRWRINDCFLYPLHGVIFSLSIFTSLSLSSKSSLKTRGERGRRLEEDADGVSLIVLSIPYSLLFVFSLDIYLSFALIDTIIKKYKRGGRDRDREREREGERERERKRERGFTLWACSAL